MSGQVPGRWARVALLVLLVLGAGLTGAPGVQAQAPAGNLPLAGARLDRLMPGYQAGGALGFRLNGVAVDEHLYRRADGSGQGVLWSARFTSRWALTEDQLDRWSAQAIGLLVDSLGADARLAGWERLAPSDLGDRQLAYRYRLASPSGQPLGEATIVVFARGAEVGLSGAGAIGTAPPDAVGLARALDAALRAG